MNQSYGLLMLTTQRPLEICLLFKRYFIQLIFSRRESTSKEGEIVMRLHKGFGQMLVNCKANLRKPGTILDQILSESKDNSVTLYFNFCLEHVWMKASFHR